MINQHTKFSYRIFHLRYPFCMATSKLNDEVSHSLYGFHVTRNVRSCNGFAPPKTKKKKMNPPEGIQAWTETEQEKKDHETRKESKSWKVAIENVPDADLEYLKQFSVSQFSDDYLREIVVRCRWDNRICDSCGDKKNPAQLKKCGCCHLAFYCSTACQKRHWNMHKQRCGKKDGPLDQGYQKLVVGDPSSLKFENDKQPDPGELIKFVTSS